MLRCRCDCDARESQPGQPNNLAGYSETSRATLDEDSVHERALRPCKLLGPPYPPLFTKQRHNQNFGKEGKHGTASEVLAQATGVPGSRGEGTETSKTNTQGTSSNSSPQRRWKAGDGGGRLEMTSRRQSRNATVTEVYVIQKRLASDDRSTLKCKSEWKSSKAAEVADGSLLQDELSTGTAVVQSSGSAHDALDCPESACVLMPQSGRVPVGQPTWVTRLRLGYPQFMFNHSAKSNAGQRYRLGQDGVRKCQIDGCVMLMEKDGAESRL